VLGDPNLLVVPATSPYKTVQDLVDDARRRPGEITYGSAGTYGASHLSIEMFCNAANIKLLHVPYRGGGPAVEAVLGGQVAMTAQGAGPLQGFSHGELRVLATFGAERHAVFPDAPTFVELGYQEVVLYVWAGLFVPKAVPPAVVARLRQAMDVVMNDPETIGVFTKAGSPAAYMGAAEFVAYVEQERKRLTAVVDKIGKLE
jgi:tripartite-type tricarboxylate transporter receptor subunit TctC